MGDSGAPIVISSDHEHGSDTDSSLPMTAPEQAEFLFTSEGPPFPVHDISESRSHRSRNTTTNKRRRLREIPWSKHALEPDSSEEEPATRSHKPAQSYTTPRLNAVASVRPGDTATTATTRTEQPAILSQSLQPAIHEEPCPYFSDRFYGITMYRGPGYCQFPVALELFHEQSEEQQICREYDEKARSNSLHRQSTQTRHDALASTLDGAFPAFERAVGREQSVVDRSREEAFVMQMLEVLPDIDPRFVEKQYRLKREKYQFSGERISIYPDAEALLTELLDMPTYPKLSERLRIEAEPFFQETGQTISYDKAGRRDHKYPQNVVALLARHFTYIPTCSISKALKEKKNAYDTLIYLDDADKNYHMTSEKWYRRSKLPRMVLEKKYQVESDSPDPFLYANIVNELQAAKQYIAREDIKAERARSNEAAERQNLEEYKRDGQLVECQVCFEDSVPLNRAVACYADQAHWFCYHCVNAQAESLVGSMKHDLRCMDGSGCREAFPLASVRRAVSAKTLDRLLFNQQQAEITAAGIEGLERCPNCNFSMICEDIEIDPYFSCQNPECFRISCRNCGELKHFPKTCEEAKKDHTLSFRHKIEEARSQAMIRICPKCSTKLIKEAGCNKLQCRCGAKICYICRKDLSDLTETYSHFRETGGGAACQLHDGGPAHDQRAAINALHDREALAAEEKAIQEAKTVDHTLDDDTLRIESGKNRQTGSKSLGGNALLTRQAQQGNQFIQGVNGQIAHDMENERLIHLQAALTRVRDQTHRQRRTALQQAHADAMRSAQQRAARHTEQHARAVAAANLHLTHYQEQLRGLERQQQNTRNQPQPQLQTHLQHRPVVPADNTPPVHPILGYQNTHPALPAHLPAMVPPFPNPLNFPNAFLEHGRPWQAVRGVPQIYPQAPGRMTQQYQEPYDAAADYWAGIDFREPAQPHDLWTAGVGLNQIPPYDDLWEEADGPFPV